MIIIKTKCRRQAPDSHGRVLIFLTRVPVLFFFLSVWKKSLTRTISYIAYKVLVALLPESKSRSPTYRYTKNQDQRVEEEKKKEYRGNNQNPPEKEIPRKTIRKDNRFIVYFQQLSDRNEVEKKKKMKIRRRRKRGFAFQPPSRPVIGWVFFFLFWLNCWLVWCNYHSRAASDTADVRKNNRPGRTESRELFQNAFGRGSSNSPSYARDMGKTRSNVCVPTYRT